MTLAVWHGVQQTTTLNHQPIPLTRLSLSRIARHLDCAPTFASCIWRVRRTCVCVCVMSCVWRQWRGAAILRLLHICSAIPHFPAPPTSAPPPGNAIGDDGATAILSGPRLHAEAEKAKRAAKAAAGNSGGAGETKQGSDGDDDAAAAPAAAPAAPAATAVGPKKIPYLRHVNLTGERCDVAGRHHLPMSQ